MYVSEFVLEEVSAGDRNAAAERLKDLDGIPEIEITEQVAGIAERFTPFLSGPYLIALWALFESGIIELADYVAQTKHLSLKLRDIRGRDPVEQWNKYFTHVAG